MNMTLSSLKKASSLDKLTKAIESASPKVMYDKDDERFWQPEVDKANNGYAVIRFLGAPAVDGEDGLPWAQLFSHGFQGPGGWYIENCPTTIGGKCPACEHNTVLWNSGVEANKEIVRKQKRRLAYVSNILVISDPNRPENEGTVRLYRYGKKIFDKIQEAMKPEFDDETAINPFDFWEGANMKLKIRDVDDFRNYDKSGFEAPSPVADSDKEIEKIWKAEHSLTEIASPDKFKSYAELKEKLNKTLGAGGAVAARAKPIDDDDVPFTAPRTAEAVSPAAAEDENDMEYFRKLVAD